MDLRNPAEGDVFVFPLEGDRFGSCRVLGKADSRPSVMVVCCAWHGDRIPDITNSRLREFLYPTHHFQQGKAQILWIAEALPRDFIHVGVIEPTFEERSIDCRTVGGWDWIIEQALLQSRWDLDQAGVRAQEAIDRCRPGEILFGISGLDKPHGESVTVARRSVATFLRLLAIVALAIAFHSVIPLAPPIASWVASIVATIAIYSLVSVYVQYRYEMRIPWQRSKVSGVEVNRVYQGPDWVKRISGLEPSWLVRIACVKLNGMVVSAGVLSQIRSFPGVSMICAITSEIEESGLKHLSKLKKLDVAWLSKSNLTDQGMKHLGRCRELAWVSLDGTDITNAGICELANLRKLRNLDLRNTSVSDLRPLQHLGGLQTLQLDETAITDSSLQGLSNSPVQYLDLNGTAITDAGLVYLGSLTNLKNLQFNRTIVGDAGLVHLRKLDKLEWIHLADTRVTILGLAELEALPRLTGVFVGYHPNLEVIRSTFPQWTILSEL